MFGMPHPVGLCNSCFSCFEVHFWPTPQWTRPRDPRLPPTLPRNCVTNSVTATPIMAMVRQSPCTTFSGANLCIRRRNYSLVDLFCYDIALHSRTAAAKDGLSFGCARPRKVTLSLSLTVRFWLNAPLQVPKRGSGSPTPRK